MNEFGTFQKYMMFGNADSTVALLQENGIEFQWVDMTMQVDGLVQYDPLVYQYELQIRSKDFEKAHRLLKAQAEEDKVSYPDDHYLRQFSDKELLEVVSKEDEWSQSDSFFAQNLLKQRGKGLGEKEVAELRENRLVELRKQSKGSLSWMILGFASSLLGGFFGIAIGYVRLTAHKRLPNGETIHLYDDKTRNSARWMIGFGIVCLVAWFSFVLFGTW